MMTGLAVAVLMSSATSKYSAQPIPLKASIGESYVHLGFLDTGEGFIRQYQPTTRYLIQNKTGLMFTVSAPEGMSGGAGLFLSQDSRITSFGKISSGRTVVMEYDGKRWQQISPASLLYCDRVYRSSSGSIIAIGKKKTSDAFTVFHYESGKETNLTALLKKTSLTCYGILEDGTVILAEGKKIFSWKSGKEIELGLAPSYMAVISLDRKSGHIFFEPARGLPESEGQACLVLKNGRLEQVMGPGERGLHNVKSSGDLIVGEEPSESRQSLARAVVVDNGKPQYLDDLVVNMSELRAAGFQGRFANVSAVGPDRRIVASGPVTLQRGSAYQIYVLEPLP